MKLVQLIYCSQVTGRLTLDSVQYILNSASKKNSARGITGFLAFNESNFLQVIEGDSLAANLLYGSICRDPRHHGVHLISFREIEERQFPHSAMGDCNLTMVDSSAIERYVDSAVFEPTKLSAEVALGLLQTLDTLRRAEGAPHGL
ncbi:MAG: BLUF domain-containing protein [Opitutus sp.]|nr:BLUF domain-containing protein [Opitutus sp.]MCS6248032.1 BLUF domain-containing protein [Opitutus sp.]MCS6274008.1 BLUF domain-containing protein [Opitutus sp.]MCS6276797.1 BLUF domain-containing protein [Opitutus sp.]MCS6301554.1 BLUF domain-containing protein [Opitutus sp.]